MRNFRTALPAIAFCMLFATGLSAQEMQWFKGNTHTHTNQSDGDSSPSVVAQWYKDHGYNFLILSDHNVLYNPAQLANFQDDNFMLIPGEEVSARFQRKPVHVNGLNIDEFVAPTSNAATMSATIQANVDAIRSANGVPHINHPNFGWAMNHLDLLQVKNYRLLEIFNGHPHVHNYGGSGHPGMEEIWDILLTSGQRIYGIAVDDAHHFKGEFAPGRSNPGRGWVVVRAPALDADAIMASLEEGSFYASTGPELDGIIVDDTSMTIAIRQIGNFGYRVKFIGAGGKVLKQTETNPAVYDFQGTEQYVRANVYDSGGATAWVQPIFFND